MSGNVRSQATQPRMPFTTQRSSNACRCVWSCLRLLRNGTTRMPLITYPLRRWLFTQITARRCFQPLVIANPFPTNSIKGRRAYATAIPELVAEKSDGTLEEISEEDLYRYRRNRWIHNESMQLNQRYLKFDLEQLLKTAVAAVSGEGARCCIRVLKCREGLNSKAYLLTMDNGSEIIARFPNPIAGPAYYTTAPEVATRGFLRDVLKIPACRIIAWSADRNNPVGAEYILEEKAPGMPLGKLWYQWPMVSKIEMISQIVKIERQLASIKFLKSGCIFFKDDIPDYISSGDPFAISPPLTSSILGRFTLGPLVSSGLWRGDRANMDMKQGPYSRPLEFVEAMATNELRLVKTHGRPRLNYHRSSTNLELPDELLDLLNRYLRLAPFMVPPLGREDTHSPTLWHPDLHIDNVFVDPGSRRITRIIDWQSAAVMPFYHQCGIPRMFKHPEGVSNDWNVPEILDSYHSLDQSAKDKVDSDRTSKICHKYYAAETKDRNPRHWAALQLENLHLRTEPSRLVVNVWEDNDAFFFRRSLVSIAEQWEYLCPVPGPCPVNFSKQELEAHASEEESMGNVADILRLFQGSWGLPPDGMVDPAAFDQVRSAVAELRDSFLADADDEAERDLFSKIWPYQDKDS